MSALSETWQVTPKQVDLDLEGDTLREECGVFGIYGHPDAAAITALGLHALQHRGQEAAGIVTFNGSVFNSERRLGLIGDNFSDRATIERLEGLSAIGHTRYSTTGETVLRNVQPLFAELDGGGFAVAHNGNLTNGLTLRRNLIRDGAICQSTTDTEVIVHLVARSRKDRVIDRFVEAIQKIEGAFALVALTNKKLIGARDPLGIRPLARRPLHSRLRDLRSRHHRRPLRPRYRQRRMRGDLGRRHRILPLRAGSGAAPRYLRIHLLRPAGFRCERPQRL
jgi:amidophosphoribosyltransferase